MGARVSTVVVSPKHFASPSSCDVARRPHQPAAALVAFAKLAIRDVDHGRVERLLAVIEDVLEQSDLQPLYRRLRAGS